MSSNVSLTSNFSVLVILSLLVLVGCSTTTDQPVADDKLIATPTYEIEQSTLPPPPIGTRVIPKPTMTPSQQPTQSPLPIYAALPTGLPRLQIEARCAVTAPIVDDNWQIANGILLEKRDPLQITILGDAGFNAPFGLFSSDRLSSFPVNSPNGQWLAYFSYASDTQFTPITIHVLNPVTQQRFDREFDNNDLIHTLGPTLFWANDTQIVVAIGLQNSKFDGVVWNPFNSETKTFSINLIDSGNAMDRFYVGPIVDPQMELATYLCEFCGNAEYQVINITTGQKEWGIDIIPAAPLGYYRLIAPVWSPDGELLAVGGHVGEIVNGLWIANRQGQTIYDLPIPTDLDGISVISLDWSPNGQYLAFARRLELSGGRIGATLSYIEVKSGQVFDVCQDLSTLNGELVWSPDSDKLAYFAGIEGSSQRLTIVDILSGETTHLIDPEGYYILTGWMDLTQ